VTGPALSASAYCRPHQPTSALLVSVVDGGSENPLAEPRQTGQAKPPAGLVATAPGESDTWRAANRLRRTSSIKW
jgi:hypothetical protein